MLIWKKKTKTNPRYRKENFIEYGLAIFTVLGIISGKVVDTVLGTILGTILGTVVGTVLEYFQVEFNV